MAVGCGWRCVTGGKSRFKQLFVFVLLDLMILACSLCFFALLNDFLFGWSSSSLTVLDSNRCMGSFEIMI